MTDVFEMDFIGLALVFIFAFLGALVAHRLRQSMIIGYILMGVVLGVMAVELPDIVGAHVFLDTGERTLRPSIELLSDMGLTFLLFFIGLEFSIKKLRRAGRPSLVIALAHFSLNMYAGALIGAAFGWDAPSAFFLAAVMSMSSLGVAAKSLIELRRLDREETEYVVGSMIVEDFLTMALLVLAMGVVAAPSVEGGQPGSRLLDSVRGAAIVYGTFVALALFLMPRFARALERVRSDEVFVLLALAAVLGSAALAYYYGMPFMLGAFFIGMAFSETRISERLQLKLLSFRDAFVAIFFLGFGLRIDMGLLTEAAGPIAAALAFVVINDSLLLSASVYLMGFNARASASLGASMLGRSDDSILFASVGGSLMKADGSKLLTKAEQLYPFSGGIALVTNFIAPLLIRKSAALAAHLGDTLPRGVVFTGAAIGRSMRPLLVHRRTAGEAGGPALVVLPLLYVFSLTAGCILLLVERADMALVACGLSVLALALQHRPLSRQMARHVVASAIAEPGHPITDHRAVTAFVGRGATALLMAPPLALLGWTVVWWLSPIAVVATVSAVLAMGAFASRRSTSAHLARKARAIVDRRLEDQARRMRKRYGRR